MKSKKSISDNLESKHESASQFHDTYNSREAVKLKLTTLKDIFSYEDPIFLISQVLIKNTLTLLTAYAGIGKSLLSLFIAYSVITGKKLFDYFEVNETGIVLIIDEENPGSFLKVRLQNIGFTEDLPIHYLHYQRVKLDRADCFSELTQIIKDLNPTLVIFDALIRIHSKKENDTEMAIVMERLRDIVNLGTTGLVIHHHRKGQGDKKEAVRGSSDILGGVDMCLSLEEKGDYLILSSPKTRTEPIESIRLKLEASDNTLAFKYIGNELNEGQIVINEVVEILQGNKCLGIKEIHDELKNRHYTIGQNRLREILQGATGKELKENTVERNKKLYTLNPPSQLHNPLYRGETGKLENDPDNNLHSFTEDTALNCETEIPNCIRSECNTNSYDMKLHPNTRKLARWCKKHNSWCDK